MRYRSAAALVTLAFAAYAQTNPAGRWEGVFNAGNREIGLSLDLARNAGSGWFASMGVPAEKVSGLVVTEVAVNGNSVKFIGVELMMSRFDLTLTPDGKLKGTVETRRGPVPVVFTRTGEAKVELIPPSPAVSKELEGDWEGALAAPGGRALRMILHFRNRPDKTVAATVDTPDSNGFGLPLNEIRQTGPAVEFGMRIAHGAFKGTLEAAGKELAGEFRHGATAMPVTFRKR